MEIPCPFHTLAGIVGRSQHVRRQLLSHYCFHTIGQQWPINFNGETFLTWFFISLPTCATAIVPGCWNSCLRDVSSLQPYRSPSSFHHPHYQKIFLTHKADSTTDYHISNTSHVLYPYFPNHPSRYRLLSYSIADDTTVWRGWLNFPRLHTQETQELGFEHRSTPIQMLYSSHYLRI